MGTENFDLVHMLWGKALAQRPFRMYAFMARTAKDGTGDNDRIYWGGHDRLAYSIGQEAPPQPLPDDHTPEAEDARTRRHAALELVRRDLRYLEEAGAITRTRKGSREHRMNAEYRLNLDLAGGQRTRTVRCQRTETARSTRQNGAPDAPNRRGQLQPLQPSQPENSNSSSVGTNSHQGDAANGDDAQPIAPVIPDDEYDALMIRAGRALGSKATRREREAYAAKLLEGIPA